MIQLPQRIEIDSVSLRVPRDLGDYSLVKEAWKCYFAGKQQNDEAEQAHCLKFLCLTLGIEGDKDVAKRLKAIFMAQLIFKRFYLLTLLEVGMGSNLLVPTRDGIKPVTVRSVDALFQLEAVPRGNLEATEGYVIDPEDLCMTDRDHAIVVEEKPHVCFERGDSEVTYLM